MFEPNYRFSHARTNAQSMRAGRAGLRRNVAAFDGWLVLTLSSACSREQRWYTRGKRDDGPSAAPVGVNRRQRSHALPGRHLAATLRAAPARRTRAFLRGVVLRSVLVGDAIRRHLHRRARPRDIF